MILRKFLRIIHKSSIICSLLCYDSQDLEVTAAVVDERVGVALGAVMAVTGLQVNALSVIQHVAAAFSHEHDLTAVIVRMESD